VLAEVQTEWDVVKGDTLADAGTWLQAGLLPNIHHRSEFCRDFCWRGPQVLGVCRRLIGPNVKHATSQLTFKMPGLTKGVDWHYDNGYGHLEPTTALSCLLALEDVGFDNGPIVLIPRSHKKGQRPLPAGQGGGGGGRKASTGGDGSTVVKLTPAEDELAAATPIPMKAGQVLVMHAQMMHASASNTSARPRRVLFNRYADADAVEAYNNDAPRLGRLLCGRTKLPAVAEFEATAESWAASVAAAEEVNVKREAGRTALARL
jgi:ectoine hydroxylase-related dioxygenase (phytanoyl-CoA dioxygenase family)